MSLLRRYRFYSVPDFPEPDRFLEPINDTFNISFAPENNQVFYRKSINTKLRLSGDDFEYMNDLRIALGECGSTRLLIQKLCSGTWVDVGDGVITFASGDWDFDRCVCELPFKHGDDYQVIEDLSYKEEINILNASPSITAGVFNGTIAYQWCNENCTTTGARNTTPITTCLTDVATWSVVQHECRPVPGGPFCNRTRWAREEITTGGPAPPGDGWTLISGSTYARPVNTEIVEDTFINVLLPTPAEYFIEHRILGVDLEGNQITFDNGRTLEDVIEYLHPLFGTPSIISNFFGINADATNPSNDAYTEALANYQNCVIWQKSDIVNASAGNNATLGNLSYEQLMSMLREWFNVYWIIDGLDTRIEHLSYFTETNGQDLTISPFSGQIIAKNKVKYSNENGINIEKHTSQDAYNKDFIGANIVYDVDCAVDRDQQTKTHSSGPFSFDLESLLSFPDNAGLNGFFFANCHEDTGTYSFIKRTGKLSGLLLFNNACSVANVHDPLWKWGREYETGFLNESPVTFESFTRRREQPDLNIIACCDGVTIQTYDPNLLMQTELGWGKVNSANFDAKRETLTLSLQHD